MGNRSEGCPLFQSHTMIMSCNSINCLSSSTRHSYRRTVFKPPLSACSQNIVDLAVNFGEGITWHIKSGEKYPGAFALGHWGVIGHDSLPQSLSYFRKTPPGPPISAGCPIHYPVGLRSVAFIPFIALLKTHSDSQLHSSRGFSNLLRDMLFAVHSPSIISFHPAETCNSNFMATEQLQQA
jgi:hypothetical protein